MGLTLHDILHPADTAYGSLLGAQAKLTGIIRGVFDTSTATARFLGGRPGTTIRKELAELAKAMSCEYTRVWQFMILQIPSPSSVSLALRVLSLGAIDRGFARANAASVDATRIMETGEPASLDAIRWLRNMQVLSIMGHCPDDICPAPPLNPKTAKALAKTAKGFGHKAESRMKNVSFFKQQCVGVETPGALDTPYGMVKFVRRTYFCFYRYPWPSDPSSPGDPGRPRRGPTTPPDRPEDPGTPAGPITEKDVPAPHVPRPGAYTTQDSPSRSRRTVASIATFNTVVYNPWSLEPTSETRALDAFVHATATDEEFWRS